MKLLKPQSIAPEIMNLMEDAKEFMIIVSPYNKVANWGKLQKSLKILKQNNARVEYYIRKDNTESYQEVKAIGFTPIPIHNLHTKLYMNERQAIVASMNLHESSDDHSLDIGYQTETKKEYDELYEYYKQYIKQGAESAAPVDKPLLSSAIKLGNPVAGKTPIQLEFFRHLEYELNHKLALYPVSREKGENHQYKIGSRTIEVFFQKGARHQYVNIQSILTGILFDFFKPLEGKLQTSTSSNVRFIPGDKNSYNSFHYSFKTPDKHPAQFSNEETQALVNEIVQVQSAIWEIARRQGDKKVQDNIHYQR